MLCSNAKRVVGSRVKDPSHTTEPEELYDVELPEPNVALLWQRLIRAELLHRLGRVVREEVVVREDDPRVE